MANFFENIAAYWQPYLISQVFSIVILIIAFKNTRIARGVFALLFLWASVINTYTIFHTPDAYLSYADMAITFYRDFIKGWFSKHHQVIVPLIAGGQFLIATGMILKGWWVKWACIGAVIFLLSIAPLLVGAGFPFSMTVSLAAWVILKKDDRNYIWKRRQLHEGRQAGRTGSA